MTNSDHDSIYVYKITLWHLYQLRTLLQYDTVYVTYTSRWYRLASRIMTWIDTIFLAPLSLVLPIGKFRLVPAGEDIPGFPSIEVSVREQVTDILLEDPPSQLAEHIASQFTHPGAESFAIKSIAYYGGLFRFTLDIAKLEAEYGGVDYLQQPHFADYNLEFDLSTQVRMHDRVLSLYLMWYKFKRLIALGIRHLSRVGSLRPLRTDKTEYILATEVGNINYAERSAGQAGYLLRSDDIDVDDVLFYKTSHALVTSVDDDEKVAEFNLGERQFVDLREEPISIQRYYELLRYFLDGAYRSTAGINTVARSVPVAIDFGALFSRFNIDHNLSLTFSNDMRKVRVDGGLITSMAELHGTHNFDYQTRPYYFNSFEHLCNHHHSLYLWSENWITDPKYFRYIEQSVSIGNVYNQDETDQGTNSESVSMFSTDVNVDGRNTLAYNTKFLKICAELARTHPDYEFILKPKFQRHTDRLISNLPDFPENFIIEEGLYNTEKLVSQSDIVLAIGFTSPGVDAIMQGTDTIIYSELGDVPDPLGSAKVVCESQEEAIALFNEYVSGAQIDSEFVQRLDPYRDSNAYKRIVANLLE